MSNPNRIITAAQRETSKLIENPFPSARLLLHEPEILRQFSTDRRQLPGSRRHLELEALSWSMLANAKSAQ